MSMRLKTLATLALLSLTLPGCSAIFGKAKLTSQAGGEGQTRSEAARELAGVYTVSGRSALDRGNTGLAIEAFTRAVTSGEAAAPALNGLGVAYARLGRYDLAARYFEQAARIDPTDSRYQSNLVLLMRSPLFAQRHEADEARRVLAQAETANLAEARARETAAPGQLQRVGANQFFIRTAAPVDRGPARMAMVVTRRSARSQVQVQSVEAAFDATVGKHAAAAAAPAEEKPVSRTVLFKQVSAERP